MSGLWKLQMWVILFILMKNGMKNKKYRFFYHYYRQYKCMSVHFRGKCYKTDNVECNVVFIGNAFVRNCFYLVLFQNLRANFAYSL